MIMILSQLFSKIAQVAVFLGMPLTSVYHQFSENPYLNSSFEEAKGLEKASNFFLIPAQYLFGARFIQNINLTEFKIAQKFEYEAYFYPKALGSLVVLPFSFTVGSFLKGLAVCDSEVNSRHQMYQLWLKDGKIDPNLEYYKKIGIKIIPQELMLPADCQNHLRRADDLKTLSHERKALVDISNELKKSGIPFWLDCGTCLGAYRYGGVIPWDFDIDISILRPDFCNAFKVLQNLDPELYEIQDWSGRDRPGSYLKVYVRKSHNLIDIYTFNINEEQKTINYIIGNENSIFLPEGWKIRERLYTKPSKFEDVFPLKLAKFDGLQLPVPNKTKEYLQLRYGENIGPVKIYDPISNQYEKDLTHPYWKFEYAK